MFGFVRRPNVARVEQAIWRLRPMFYGPLRFKIIFADELSLKTPLLLSSPCPSLCLLFLQEGDASYRSGIPVVPVGLLLHSLPKALPSSAMPTPGLSPEQTLANKQTSNKYIYRKKKQQKRK